MGNTSGSPVKRRLNPAKGFDRNGRRRIVVEFDEDTFAQVAGRAFKEGVSFAEMVRQLVEWGLEA
jgi:hypothetical protein